MSDWMRTEAPKYGLGSQFADLQNLDYIWHPYRDGWVISLEEKQFGIRPSAAQQDTHRVVSQLLSLGSTLQQKIITMRGLRSIEFRGHHVVVFEQRTPDDSTWIEIDGIRSGKEELLQLLRTGESPASYQIPHIQALEQLHQTNTSLARIQSEYQIVRVALDVAYHRQVALEKIIVDLQAQLRRRHKVNRKANTPLFDM